MNRINMKSTRPLHINFLLQIYIIIMKLIIHEVINIIKIHRFSKKYFNEYLFIDKEFCLAVEKLWLNILRNTSLKICKSWYNFDEFYKDIKTLKNFDKNKFINNRIKLTSDNLNYNKNNCYFIKKKYSVGDEFITINGDRFRIIKRLKNKKFIIQFIKTGNIKEIHMSALNNKNIKDRENKK